MRALVFTGLLIALCGLAARAGSSRTWQLPDASTGRIDGHPAILFWPVKSGTDELLDPTGCEVHALEGTTRRELVFACGEWFLPPEGRYSAWIESERWISTAPTVFAYGGGPFQGHGMRVTVPVVPAGLAVFSFVGDVPSSATVRFLSLDGPTHALERRVSLDVAQRGVRMPARRALAGIFTSDDDAIAVTKPFDVPNNGTIPIKLSVAKTATVMVVLSRPSGADHSKKTAIPVLQLSSGERPPDVLLNAPTRIYAVWYELPAESATLAVRSTELRLTPVPLKLAPGKVATVRKTLDLAQK